MAGATFGRKGIGAAVAAPAGRRAQFIQPPAAPSARDEMERRRAAFIDSERARAEQAVEVARAATPVVTRPIFTGGKSLTLAYVLWLLLGLISAHRFYLGRPLTGIAQTGLWYVSLMFWMAGYDVAVGTLAAGLLWVVADGWFVVGMTRETNETLQARAEMKALEALAGKQT